MKRTRAKRSGSFTGRSTNTVEMRLPSSPVSSASRTLTGTRATGGRSPASDASFAGAAR